MRQVWENIDVNLDFYHAKQRMLDTIINRTENTEYKAVSIALSEAIVSKRAGGGRPSEFRSKEEQQVWLAAVFRKFDGRTVWGPNSDKAFKNLDGHIKSGCLSPANTKLAVDSSRLENLHRVLNNIQSRVSGGLELVSYQLHDTMLRRNLRMAAKSGSNSNLSKFRQTTRGSHHIYLVNFINHAKRRLGKDSKSNSPLLMDTVSQERFGVVESQ